MGWKIISSKKILKNEFFTVSEDKCKKTDGTFVEKYYTIDTQEAAIIAAFTSKNELILVEQYRHPVKKTDFELPAGYIEKNELTSSAIKRELLEETGYEIKKVTKIGECYMQAGLISNKISFFIGFNAKKIAAQNLDTAEEINVHLVSWPKALKMFEWKKIKDMASVAGFLLAQKYLNQHKHV